MLTVRVNSLSIAEYNKLSLVMKLILTLSHEKAADYCGFMIIRV